MQSEDFLLAKRSCPATDHCTINCLLGFEFNDLGCPQCRCRNPCTVNIPGLKNLGCSSLCTFQNITCPEKDHICILAQVECTGRSSCPPVPRCIANACPHGAPILNVTTLSPVSCRGQEECGPVESSFCRILTDSTGYCCPSPRMSYSILQVIIGVTFAH